MAQYLAADKAKAFGGIGGRLLAGGTGDNAKVNGTGFDRMAPGEQGYNSCLIVVSGAAVMASGKTLSIALEIQESADNITFDTAVVIFATKVVATEPVLVFQTSDAVDLKKRKRYIRANVTPDLNASGTDTAHWGSAIVGMDPLVGPAS